MELSMVRCNQIKIEITDENQPGPKQLLLNAFSKGAHLKTLNTHWIKMFP